MGQDNGVWLTVVSSLVGAAIGAWAAIKAQARASREQADREDRRQREHLADRRYFLLRSLRIEASYNLAIAEQLAMGRLPGILYDTTCYATLKSELGILDKRLYDPIVTCYQQLLRTNEAVLAEMQRRLSLVDRRDLAEIGREDAPLLRNYIAQLTVARDAVEPLTSADARSPGEPPRALPAPAVPTLPAPTPSETPPSLPGRGARQE